MHRYLTEMCSIIPELKDVKTITLINAGYSSEFKYNILTNYDINYLLRLTSYKFSSRKKFDVESLTQLVNMGVKCSKPLANGYSVDENCYYVLLTWIEGIDASKALPSLSTEKQFDIGYHAGKDLKLMHTLKSKNITSNWYNTFEKKWLLNKSIYLQDDIRIKHDNNIFNFIEEHFQLIKERPMSFLHDDFHPDNIVVNNGFYTGTIDFNRCSYGDPWHDFAKLFFYGSEISKPYCKGQLKSYFQGNIPPEFWQVNALYTAILMFNTLSWIKKASPQHLKPMMSRVDRVIEEFDIFRSYKPVWLNKNS